MCPHARDSFDSQDVEGSIVPSALWAQSRERWLACVKGALTASELHDLIVEVIGEVNSLYVAKWWRRWNPRLPHWPTHETDSDLPYTAQLEQLVVSDDSSSALVLFHLAVLDSALDYTGESTQALGTPVEEPAATTPKKPASKKGASKKRPIDTIGSAEADDGDTKRVMFDKSGE